MRKLLILFLIPALSYGALTLKDGKLVNKETMATESIQDHYSAMLDYHNKENWRRLAREAYVVIHNFSASTLAREANYFMGVAQFKQSEFAEANKYFTDYLTSQATPKFFEETIQYKFEIAEHFRGGIRKPIMGLRTLPKWASGGDEAVSIYDEVIAALPHHDLAAFSLYGKGDVQAQSGDFRASVESLQTLIRRFPKHHLSIEAYIKISEVYLQQSQSEYPDTDYLDLAELNLRKFRAQFPGEERVAVAKENFVKMQQYFAEDLFETARFYERTKKWGAAKMYYSKIVQAYPESSLGKKASERLSVLTQKIDRVEAKKANK